MHKRSTTRLINGIIAAIVVCLFAVHGILGALETMLPIAPTLVWVVWFGVCLVGVHVLLSIATSYLQLTDTENPASARKKRHLLLKWITGVLLAIVIAIHIANPAARAGSTGVLASPNALADSAALANPAALKITLAVLAALLAWHIYVCMKSLLADIGIDSKWLVPLRVVVCVVAAVITVVVLLH